MTEVQGNTGTARAGHIEKPEYAPPLTANEKLLTGIATEILEIQRIGMNDGFLELGGDSLLATLFIVAIRDQFGVELPLEVIFEAPTMRALCERIENTAQEGNWPALPPLEPQNRDGAIPLTCQQEDFWWHAQNGELDDGIKIPMLLRLHTVLDTVVLRRCFDEIIRRHEALRTRIVQEDGHPVQYVGDPEPFALETFDLSHLPQPDRDDEGRRVIQEFLRQPIDGTLGKMVRACAVKLERDDWVLLLLVHHFAADAWAMRLLRDELSTLYTAFAQGMPSPLPAVRLQSADYGIWQRKAFDALKARNLPYWQEHLGAAPPFTLPPDLPPPETKSYVGTLRPFPIPATLLSQMHDFGRREDVTMTMIIMSALHIVLSHWTGRDDVISLLITADRTRPELQPMISYVIGGIVPHADLSGDPDLGSVVRHTKKIILDGLSHAELLTRLLMTFRPGETLSDVYVNMIVSSINTAETAGSDDNAPKLNAETTMFGIDRPIPKIPMPLGFEVIDTPDGPLATVQYHADVFEAATIERFVENFLMLLEEIVAHPARRLSELPLLPMGRRTATP